MFTGFVAIFIFPTVKDGIISYRKKKWQITYYKQIYEEEGLQGLLEQL